MLVNTSHPRLCTLAVKRHHDRNTHTRPNTQTRLAATHNNKTLDGMPAAYVLTLGLAASAPPGARHQAAHTTLRPQLNYLPRVLLSIKFGFVILFYGQKCSDHHFCGESVHNLINEAFTWFNRRRRLAALHEMAKEERQRNSRSDEAKQRETSTWTHVDCLLIYSTA